MKNGIIIFFSFAFSIGCFLQSQFIYQYYQYGDLEHYKYFYDNIKSYSIIEGFAFYTSSLGASEPIYYIIVYIVSFLDINKELFFTLINSVFGFCLSYSLLKLRMHPLLLIPLFYNFYFLVLLGPAERLKMSLFFIILIFMVRRTSWKQLLFLFSILTHFQSFLLLIFNNARRLSDFVIKFLRGRLLKSVFFYIIIAFFFLIGLLIFAPTFERKVIGYSDNMSIDNIFKSLLFLILTILYVKKSDLFLVLFMHLPFLLASFVVGESRIVIFSFFIFVFWGIQYKRGLNLGLTFCLIYFAYKGVVFLNDIVQYGEGF